MRNLKRALSLTLASVMLLGMMVVGTSAAGYPDVDDSNNVEAIEVLQAVRIMVGDAETGNFRPDAPVSRAEMAVILADLLNLTTSYYASSCPFYDVSGSYAWARGAVGACAAAGVVSGRGDGIYDPAATVTAVEAASMIMRTLGYFKYSEDYEGGFNLATVKQANLIGLFAQVGSDADTPLTRDQVAQMTLNALRSDVVDFTGNPSIEINGVKTGYKAEYTPRTSPEAKYNSITNLVSDIANTNQYYIQLGEQRYDGDLKLYDNDLDEFDRPARTWEYKGEEVGTYVKEELLRKDYSVKVTGKDLYDLLTKNTIDTYTFVISVDGVRNTDASAKTMLDKAWFDTSYMVRTNDKAIGGTGNGVTTEVYVDTINKIVYVSVINTYLAIAAEDYDEKNDDVDLTVYKINDANNSTRNPIYVKAADTETINVSGEDFAIKDVAKDDMFLVNVADGEIQIMKAPEVLSSTTISAFAKKDWVNADGSQYDYASTAMYDTKVLDKYDDLNMKELTYNVILDQYGYLIGLERNEDPDQYVFLTGLETGLSNLSSKNVDANIIHMDGTMETVTVDLSKSKNYNGNALTDGRGVWYKNLSQMNTWCTYTVSESGVYTLTQVAVAGTTNPIPGTDLSAAQFAQNVGVYDDSTTGGKAGVKNINEKRVSLNASSAATRQYVYGNDKTVYINVELKKIPANDTTGGNLRWIINDVDSVTTGVKNVNLVMEDLLDGLDGYQYPDAEIYTLYGDNGYVIAAVTIGEDDGSASSFAYITSADVKKEEYGHKSNTKAPSGKWAWYREAIVDGEKVMLTEVGDNLTKIGPAKSQGNMKQGEWYEIKTNADNEVRKVEPISWTAPNGSSTAGKYIREVLDVEQSVNTHGTVLLSDETTSTALRFNGDGTLYTEQAPSQKGFSVSPDVKTILCLADEDKNEFDHVSDTYTGYVELQKALNQMNADSDKFVARTVEVNAILKEGRAIVIIINDKNPEDAKGNAIGQGGGKYYEYESAVFSNGMARAIVNVTRPAWVTDDVKLDYQFDVMVNGKLYETVTSASSGYKAIAASSATATTTWSNWAGSWGVPFDADDKVTIENFKWVDLNKQTYKVKFVDQNENELTVGDKATDDLKKGATTTETLAYNASGLEIKFQLNSSVYEDGTVKYTVIGAYKQADKGLLTNMDGAKAQSVGVTTAKLLAGDIVDNDHADRENFVYVKIDLSSIGSVDPTYSVAVDTEDSLDSGIALSEFGVTGTNDKDVTLAVGLENGADDKKAGYRYNTKDVQITLSAAPKDVISYKVTVEGMGSAIVTDGSATNLSENTTLITLNEDVTITKDMVKVEVYENKLAIESVSWTQGRLIINFNEAIKDTTATADKFKFAVGEDAKGDANTNEAAVAEVSVNGNRVVIEFSGDGLVAGNTVEADKGIATETAKNTLGAANKVITLTADGKGTVADKK